MIVRSNQDIVNQAVLEVSDMVLYDVEKNRSPFRHGPLDPRLVSIATVWCLRLWLTLGPGNFEQVGQMRDLSGLFAVLYRPLWPCPAAATGIPYRLPRLHSDYSSEYLQGEYL